MLHGVRINTISCGRRARLIEDLKKTGLALDLRSFETLFRSSIRVTDLLRSLSL